MYQLKKFLSLLAVSLYVAGYGCSTPHTSVFPESSHESQQIVRLNNKVSQLDEEIERLKLYLSSMKEKLRQSQYEKADLVERISTLEHRIAYLAKQKENHNDALDKAGIEKLKHREKDLSDRVMALHSILSDIHSSIASSSNPQQDAEVMAAEIKSSITALNAELHAINKAKQHLQQQLDQQALAIVSPESVQEEIQEAGDVTASANSGSNNQVPSETRSANSNSDGASLSASKVEHIRPLSLDNSATETANIVEVFYATNRQRLSAGWLDNIKPLLLPLLLLPGFLLGPIIIRLTLQERWQRGSIIVLQFAIGAAFVVFVVKGIQSSALNWQKKNTLAVQYGADRIRSEDLPFEMGVCHVSIPPVHEPGVVERMDWKYFEFTVNPDKHFVLSDIQPHPEASFYSELNKTIQASDDQDMFVFVHGFHNTFEDAAFRTAQIAYDMKFTGAPVFFSWPSQGNVVDYLTDESNAGAAVEDLRIFLAGLLEHSNAKKIHLIAHSMGNRVLTRAVKEMSLPQKNTTLFNEVVLAAPDMDAKTFKNVVPVMAKRVDRVTLYASSNDKALVVSNVLHGEYQRAGESKPYPVVIHPIESIDVSGVTDGHSYIADDGQILNDLNNILKHSRRLTEKIAQPVSLGDDKYWVLGRKPLRK